MGKSLCRPFPHLSVREWPAFAAGASVYAGIDAICGGDHLGRGDNRWQAMDYGTCTAATYPHPTCLTFTEGIQGLSISAANSVKWFEVGGLPFGAVDPPSRTSHYQS
jgi:hypothetical protein